ncbi:hypothetical protein AAHA92_25354 [Salvia divinorum]|uniref:Uncharacterized protein n=1 Tax=Salvia divinorum TaxID=28513 RepID=A0ABD1GAJ7_SALDI
MLCIAGDFLLYFHGCQSTSRRYFMLTSDMLLGFSAIPWSMMALTGSLQFPSSPHQTPIPKMKINGRKN